MQRLVRTLVVLDLTVYMVMAILALSLALIWGYGGILCFGQSAFFGLGGYAYAVAMFNIGETTIPLLLAIVVPAVFAALLGYFMFYGRISDVYLGVITLTVTLILFNSSTRLPGGIPHRHGAARRLQRHSRHPAAEFPGNPARRSISKACSIFATAALLATYFGLRLLLARQFGRIMVRIRENERRAELLGYDPRAYKLTPSSLEVRWPDLPASCLPIGEFRQSHDLQPCPIGADHHLGHCRRARDAVGPVVGWIGFNGSLPRSAPTSLAAARIGGPRSSPTPPDPRDHSDRVCAAGAKRAGADAGDIGQSTACFARQAVQAR